LFVAREEIKLERQVTALEMTIDKDRVWQRLRHCAASLRGFGSSVEANIKDHNPIVAGLAFGNIKRVAQDALVLLEELQG
jgi:hypothetical protein